MAVAFDAKMTAGNGDSGRCAEVGGAATSISTGGMTVGVGATLLVVVIHIQRNLSGDPGTPTGTWNGSALTLGVTAFNTQNRTTILYIINPAPGNNTLALAWTFGSHAYVSCVSFTGTDPTTPIVTADNVTTTSSTTVGPITSAADDATVAVWGTNGSDPTVNFTEIFSQAPLDPGAGANYTLGGTSNSHTFTGAGGTIPCGVGVHVLGTAAAGGTNPKGPLNNPLCGPFGGPI